MQCPKCEDGVLRLWEDSYVSISTKVSSGGLIDWDSVTEEGREPSDGSEELICSSCGAHFEVVWSTMDDHVTVGDEKE